MKRPVAFVDLDNCISDDKWRWPLFDLHLPEPNDRYWRYHDQCHRDIHSNPHVIRDLATRYSIAIATSRPEVVRHKTTNWLRFWGIRPIAIFMRPNDNHEPSPILKRRMLETARNEGLDVQCAIDDRTDILDMYADEGVRICQRVFIHPTEYTHP